MNFLPAQSQEYDVPKHRYIINLDYVMYFIDHPGGQLTAVMRDGARMVVERSELESEETEQQK